MRRLIAKGTRCIACILVFLACLPAFSQAVKAPGYRIAGTVLNAATNEPIRRATVSLLSEAERQMVASVETDNEGRFSFDSLPGAKYPLTASKRGFLTAYYDEHDGGFNTAIVTGEDQETSKLVFRLVPGASLHGVVTSDGGDPVEGAKVMLFAKPHGRNRDARITQAAETTTDDTGAYEFDGLAVGECLLAVKAEPWFAQRSSMAGSQHGLEPNSGSALDAAYPVTFFDSTTDESSASPIVLTGGSREEANVNLRAVPALHLTVQAPLMQDRHVPPVELKQSIFGTYPPFEGISSMGHYPLSGAIEMIGIAPGHYELTQGDPPRIAEIDATTSQQIDPSIGTPTVTVSGSLRASNGSALQENLDITLRSLDEARPHSPQQTTSIQGAFRFLAVRPGSWEFIATDPDKTLSVTSLIIGSQTRPGNELIVRDKPLQVIATVSLVETHVEGIAQNDGKGVPGVMIVLIPKKWPAFRSLTRRDQSDSDGSFSLHDVAPGQYTVVAIEDGWELDWERPEVIGRYLSKGVAVTVTESSGKLLRLSEAVPVQSR